MGPKRAAGGPEPRFRGFSRGSAARGKQTILVPGRLEFVVSGADVSLVNGLRRAILTDVPTVSFRFDATDPDAQDVQVMHNTCNLHNEFVGERLGLVPLHLTKKEMLDYKPSSWRFELDVSNRGSRPLDVTTADIQVVPVDAEEAPPGRDKLFPANPASGRHPLLVVLMPAKHGVVQRLALEATSSFGTGELHARYSPVSVCAFAPVPDEEEVARQRKAAADKASFDALDAKRIVRRDGRGDPAAFSFFLESQCGMTPEEIVESGLEALAARMRTLADDSDGPRVTEVPPQTDSPADIRSLKLDGESETAGALVQAELLGGGLTDFAGYFVPHQLERSIVCRMRVFAGSEPRAMLRAACEAAANKVEDLLAEFREAAF